MKFRYLPALLFLAIITTCVEIDISVPSFPDISTYLGVNASLIQQTITFNFLGYFLGALLYGPLSEAYGRRRVLIYGHALIFIGALGCFLADNIHFLLVSRFIQGLGASAPVVLVFTIIAEAYEQNYALKLYGLINAGLATLMAIAPILGGFINQLVGWRGNYGSVVLLSGLTLILLILLLPETLSNRNKLNLKTVCKTYLNLCTSQQFMTASLVPSILFAAYMSYIGISAFLYTKTFNLSLSGYLSNQAIIITTFAFISYNANTILAKIGYRKALNFSFFTLLSSVVLLIYLGYINTTSFLPVTLSLSLFSLGFALCYPIIFQKSLEYFPELRGSASSLIMGVRAILVTVITGITSFYYNGTVLSMSIPISLTIMISSILMMRMLFEKSKPAQELHNETDLSS